MKNKQTNKLLLLLLLLIFVLTFVENIYSQLNQTEIITKNKKGKPTFIKFNTTKINNDIKSINVFLKEQYGLDDKYSFKEKINSKRKVKSLEYNKYHVFYNDVKIEYLTLVTVSKKNILKKLFQAVPSFTDFKTTTTLSEKDAFEKALSIINAKKYLWEDKRFDLFKKNKDKLKNKPKGELVILDKTYLDEEYEPILAYKFDIYATTPFSNATYYINAINGELLHKNNKYHHANSNLKNNKTLKSLKNIKRKKTNSTSSFTSGTAATKYSGSQTIETEFYNGSYRLRDYSRGNGIETYNSKSIIDSLKIISDSVDFTDNDNNWTFAEHNNTDKDNAALDAHWGAMMTYDYFYQKHQRNSYDNNGSKIKNYVHMNLGLPSLYPKLSKDNALWEPVFKVMIYGDGDVLFDALTSLDVVGHEIAHGFAYEEVNFTNPPNTTNYEPKTINEGLSDIWGAMVEHYAAPNKSTYLTGEDITLTSSFLRSMISPGSTNQPSTYQGAGWVYSGLQPHHNSTVLSHWFYILAEGDPNQNFNGIGKEKAAKILYLAETSLMIPFTTFSLTRQYTISAAEDIYGVNSAEAAIVCQAWYAVGVGSNCSVTYSLSGDDTICGTATSTYNLNYSPPNTIPTWSVSSNLQIVSSTNSSVNIKAINSSINGSETITVNVNGDVAQFDVWIGKPKIDVAFNPVSNYVYLDLIGDVGTSINKQGVTNVTWQKISDNGACGCVISSYSNSILKGLAQGNCNDWSMYVKITASNSCGSTSIYKTITPPSVDDCESNFTFNYDSIILECDESTYTAENSFKKIKKIYIYNLNGNLVRESKYKKKSLSGLSKGVYIIKVVLKSGKVLTKTVSL